MYVRLAQLNVGKERPLGPSIAAVRVQNGRETGGERRHDRQIGSLIPRWEALTMCSPLWE